MPVFLSGGVSMLMSIVDQRTAVSGAANETGTRAANIQGTYPIVSGTAAGAVDVCWSDTRTLAISAAASLDLFGVLTDAFGATVTFVKVRGIAIVSAVGNTSTLTISRPAANGVLLFGAASGSLFPLSGGGTFLWLDPAVGFGVTAGTADLLTITNAATASATFTVGIIGTSV
jgi:hypothetical protein